MKTNIGKISHKKENELDSAEIDGVIALGTNTFYWAL